MHHYADRAMIGIRCQRVNVCCLHTSQESQQKYADKGCGAHDPWPAFAKLHRFSDRSSQKNLTSITEYTDWMQTTANHPAESKAILQIRNELSCGQICRQPSSSQFV
jgi:hypothetical protein